MIRIFINHFVLVIFLLLLGACGTVKAPYYSDDAIDWQSKRPEISNKHIHSLYLIGDGGELDDTIQNRNFVLDATASLLSKETVETSLVLLGDNVYPHGLPKKNHPYRDMGERILDAQLELSKLHNGRTYFIPGNHDWNKHKKGGRKAILRQEEYVKAYNDGDKNIKFYPKNACGDPEIVKVNKDLVYVFLDTQWWLQNWSHEKKMNRKCEIKSRGDLLKRIEEIFIEYKNDEIIVLLHHPIKSNGKHGGKFNLKHHLFPLTEAKHNLWIPLPIIGSAYPIYRNVTGSTQDITNAHNEEMMQGMDEIAKRLRVNVVFASGHDHGMQFFDNDRVKYIVSGGGSRRDYTQQGRDATYARDARGFAKIDFYENNESWLSIYTIQGFDHEPVLEYKAQLRAPREGTVEEEVKYDPIEKSEKIIAANDQLGAGAFKKLFLGAQYRDIWTTPVAAEVIDLESKHGGLTPIKKGGGMASNSLRMQKENGQQYILRSIKKDYTKLVPAGFENLKLIDVLADQNSASHPYNALVIPHLSKAAGVYYTDPKLVYLKHQRGLGNYNSQFPEELYLLEERPSGDWSGAEQFGNSDEIIGYADLLDILREKKNHHIDQEWVLKSRMFDLFIHDWDRHDDQWRWAKFDEDGKHIYRPIPRDRDQAFYKFKGIVPWYIANFVMKKFKTMKGDVRDVKNLAFNAKHFDRYFLHELEWSVWEEVITQLQNNLTDDQIEQAVTYFPKEVGDNKDVVGLPGILKSRRDNLLEIGKKLYDFLTKEVEITGTDNKDNFEIEQHADGSMMVSHYIDRKGEEDLLKYKRTFVPEETKEVRIYGLRGKDDFKIEGSFSNAIRLRIIGGEDDDEIKNKVDGRKVYAYDDPKGMKWKGDDIIDHRSEDLEANEYDRHGFQYNSNTPGLKFGNTVDDGFWIGASMKWISEGWRKTPYKAKQELSFIVAPGSQDAFQFDYEGHFPDAIGKLDLAPTVDIQFPHYENFFGLGSDSENPLREIEYNWVRMKNFDVDPMFRLNLTGGSYLDFGPTYRYRSISRTDGRVTDDERSFFTEEAIENRGYFGGALSYNFGFVDNKVFPSNGFILSANASHLVASSKDEAVSELDISTTFYIQLLARPKLVLANSTGFMRSYGDRQFYHYPGLGNNRGLRGFRNERFRGVSAFYNNLDLRFSLFKWKNNFVPMEIGLVGGYDVGKVSLAEDRDDPWQSSHTIGVWFDLIGVVVLQPYYSFNDDQNTFSLRMGFNF